MTVSLFALKDYSKRVMWLFCWVPEPQLDDAGTQDAQASYSIDTLSGFKTLFHQTQ